MSILSKIKSLFTYVDIKPLIYDEHLRQAYCSTSVTGGTIKGKNVVVTGATSGIGYATAQRFLSEGCNVILTGRNENKLKEAVGSLTYDNSSQVSYIVMDQLNPSSVKNGVVQAFTISPIDLWVNCAGIFKKTDRSRKFRGITADTFFEVVNTNLKSTV